MMLTKCDLVKKAEGCRFADRSEKPLQWNILPPILFLRYRLEDQAMTQYGDDKNRIVDENTGMPLGQASYQEEKTLADERRSVSLWGMLAAGILVILIAAASFAIWPGTSNEPASTASTTSDPINAQPSGQGTLDNNPATGSIKPPAAAEPAPAGGASGPTGAPAPSAQ
jgi:hypothetical protein